MRLDCDEDIASARPLFDLYNSRGLPFSLAVKTGQSDSADHIKLLEDVLNAGGAVLSHSVTHAGNWGGSAEACYEEARQSSDWLEQRLPGLKVRYAVSPFHQNPSYVPWALKEAGLKGFIGGIIANDPEMLLARGGTIPGGIPGIVTHSQQCMLHGDCMLADDDPLVINKQAFRNAFSAGSLFGYLDHPFSPRYDYGWGTEEYRIARHAEFIDFIEGEMAASSVIWLSEEEALDWIASKMALILRQADNRFVLEAGRAHSAIRDLQFSVRWRGKTLPLSEFTNEK
jgi:hypothetical protein